jgi:hypothetical protein
MADDERRYFGATQYFGATMLTGSQGVWGE